LSLEIFPLSPLHYKLLQLFLEISTNFIFSPESFAAKDSIAFPTTPKNKDMIKKCYF